jgi:hypothetical protein
MLLARAALPFCALLLMAAAPASSDEHCRPHMGMAGGMAMFSPEQRLMMMADAEKATADGSIDMKDYRALQRDKLMAMSADKRAAYFADLTKRWAALSPAEQAALKAKGEARRKEREAHGGAMGGDKVGGDHPNCPPPPPKG